MSRMILQPYLTCEINLPPALRGEDLHTLPPYAKTQAYPVDAFPECPKNWERGGPKDKAFFVEVSKGKGLWLDLNTCLGHSHHVAAVLSIQGVNPLTGKRAECPKMEQYQEGDIPQNYLATTGTPSGKFWLDGFRGENGEVRQYFFTEETLRGIAAQVLGEERSFSIGIAFFLAKVKKPRGARSPWNENIPETPNHGSFPFPGNRKGPQNPTQPGYTWPPTANEIDHTLFGEIRYASTRKSSAELTGKRALKHQAAVCTQSLREEKTNHVEFHQVVEGTYRAYPEAAPAVVEISCENLEIAAGARIRQEIGRDPERLDFWNPDPEGVLYIHYVNEAEGSRIREAGRVGSETESALKNLRVGN